MKGAPSVVNKTRVNQRQPSFIQDRRLSFTVYARSASRGQDSFDIPEIRTSHRSVPYCTQAKIHKYDVFVTIRKKLQKNPTLCSYLTQNKLCGYLSQPVVNKLGFLRSQRKAGRRALQISPFSFPLSLAGIFSKRVFRLRNLRFKTDL